MAIKKKSITAHEVNHFDLFPFIALMMIVLATLLFITMTMASINVGAGAAEGWIPTTTPGEHRKVPVLVEWDGEIITIQRRTTREHIPIGKETRRWWNSDWEFRNFKLRSFLEEMTRLKETHYVLFAVRPSGFGNFQTVADEFRSKGVKVGYEPVEQGKRIRLKVDKEATR